MQTSSPSTHWPTSQPVSRRFMLSTNICKCSCGFAVRLNFSRPSTGLRNFHIFASACPLSIVTVYSKLRLCFILNASGRFSVYRSP